MNFNDFIYIYIYVCVCVCVSVCVWGGGYITPHSYKRKKSSMYGVYLYMR